MIYGDFEWNSTKSVSNKEKHGISFKEATFVWEDPERIEITAITKQEEERTMIIGMISPKIYAVVVTYRTSKIRIISARRARIKEMEIYEENKSKKD